MVKTKSPKRVIKIPMKVNSPKKNKEEFIPKDLLQEVATELLKEGFKAKVEPDKGGIIFFSSKGKIIEGLGIEIVSGRRECNLEHYAEITIAPSLAALVNEQAVRSAMGLAKFARENDHRARDTYKFKLNCNQGYCIDVSTRVNSEHAKDHFWAFKGLVEATARMSVTLHKTLFNATLGSFG